MKDNLDGLVVSGKELDRKLVADFLAPYMRLDKDDCSIRPMEAWNPLKVRLKIMLYLIARKAMVALEFALPTEGATPTEIARSIGVKQGTVNPALRGLLSDIVLEQSKDGRYFIPNHAIEKVKAMLSGNSSGGS